MPLDWDDDTKISSQDELKKPVTKDRDRAYLIVLAGASVGEMYKIAKSETLIGRGSQADIHVVDDGISRRHAMIVHKGDRISVQDLVNPAVDDECFFHAYSRTITIPLSAAPPTTLVPLPPFPSFAAGTRYARGPHSLAGS